MPNLDTMKSFSECLLVLYVLCIYNPILLILRSYMGPIYLYNYNCNIYIHGFLK